MQRDIPYNIGPIDPYSIEILPSISVEPSQRLFWGDQGSNQVGGNGWWATLTNKFPFLGKMFGRMELPTQYGVPEFTQFGIPGNIQPQFNQAQYQQLVVPTARNIVSAQYRVPEQQYGVPRHIQPQFNQAQFRQAPFARDVGVTDDAVIITPPQVPVFPQPVPVVPQPLPIAPQPVPVAPQPAPQPSPQPGYNYDKPLYRLELPRK